MEDKALTITQKLRCIQTEIKAPKSQYNSFGKYSFRNVEDIQEALKPYLKTYECAVTFRDDIVLIGDRYYYKATAILKDNDGEEAANGFARESEEKKGMDDAQLTGSVASYARKYALSALLALDDTRDADSLNNPGSTAKTQAAKPAAKATTTPKATPKQAAKPAGITAAQVKQIYAIIKEKGYTNAETAKQVLTGYAGGVSINSLDTQTATDFIKALSGADKPTLDAYLT